MKVTQILILIVIFSLLTENASIQTEFVKALNVFVKRLLLNTSILELIARLVSFVFYKHGLLIVRFVKIQIFRQKTTLYCIKWENLAELGR